ncbi:FAD-dependent oxidoreductase [Acrocarpospora macrocephala]|uniref:FAD-dependent oxidoreductase 2 FAD-binding domain-containing protein n=1 Tax=Acrocarpospora macrocephala TaxID=150177 RepID=A0A5M3WMB7_9ACTN|nr:FAD-dependent oxidoreductase [Acrocarpospora macrocephala]GES08331.1 hypothetical protein Amac_019270 [Acrocarpospora macrocephala]
MTRIAGLPYQDDLPERAGVVVLGSGLAGCAALLAAAEAGRYAVMVEKTGSIGGSTVLSAGLSAFAGTDEQHALGITDSIELLRRDLLEVGDHRNDVALVDLYCAHQLETYSWLRRHGVVYGEIHAASGQTVPRSHPTDTTAMLVRLLVAAGKLGARLVMDTAAERLVYEDGRVVGVDVRLSSGERRRVWADAVVLATGGFARNNELLTRFAPQMEHALRAGGAGCEGDGLKMAMALGAGIRDMPYVKGTYGIYAEPHPHEDGTGILAVYKGAIAVNGAGQRFVDESRNYKEIGDVALRQPGGTTWQVLDATVMAQSSDDVPIYAFAERDRAGMLVRADSVEELEQRLALPAGSLQTTVADYNRRIASSEPDPMGREFLCGGFGRPFALDTPPFYAQPTKTVVLATYCGVTVDTHLRVLDWWGEPIGRLFAAGEIVGGFHGSGYMTGTSIGKAAIFGRLSGTHSAAVESELTW